MILGAWMMAFGSAGLWAAEPVSVFVLHAYSHDYSWTRSQHDGFMAALKADGRYSYDVSVEFLAPRNTGATGPGPSMSPTTTP